MAENLAQLWRSVWAPGLAAARDTPAGPVELLAQLPPIEPLHVTYFLLGGAPRAPRGEFARRGVDAARRRVVVRIIAAAVGATREHVDGLYLAARAHRATLD